MAEEFPVAPARMASLRDKDKNGSEKEKKGRGWFGKNKGRDILQASPGCTQLVTEPMGLCV